MESIVEEGLIPLNYNFNIAKQQVTLNQEYNPTLNINDPMVAHAIQKQREREALSNIMQQKANYKGYANMILNELMKAIDQLIIGNTKKGFNYDDSLILLNSIRNKCNEILNTRKLYIDNDIIIEQATLFQSMYENQYVQDCMRYKLKYQSNTISFNSDEGIVKFNPHGLYDIVCDWCNKHQTHNQMSDTMLFS